MTATQSMPKEKLYQTSIFSKEKVRQETTYKKLERKMQHKPCKPRLG